MDITAAVPTLSIAFMAFSAVFSVGLPVALFLVMRKSRGLKAVPMLAGASAFILFAIILESLLHAVVLRRDAGGEIMLLRYPWAYVTYGALAAGVFEETARFVSFTFLKKKYEGQQTGLSYGIGHGGIEAALVLGPAMVNNLIVSLMINAGLSQSIPGLSQSAIAALTQTNPGIFLVGALERVFALTIQISLSLLVWRAATQKKSLWLFPLAILLHALVDVAPALMQAGVLTSLFLVEAIVCIAAAAIVWLTWMLLKKKEPLYAEPAN